MANPERTETEERESPGGKEPNSRQAQHPKEHQTHRRGTQLLSLEYTHTYIHMLRKYDVPECTTNYPKVAAMLAHLTEAQSQP